MFCVQLIVHSDGILYRDVIKNGMEWVRKTTVDRFFFEGRQHAIDTLSGV